MKSICLLALLCAVPIEAAAQSAERPRGRGDAGSERRADTRSDGLSPLGLQPRQTPKAPAWEQRQAPPWEQRQVPPWERPQIPSWALRPTPGWELNTPAREPQPEVRDERGPARTTRPNWRQPAVVYLVPPYRYFPNSATYTGVTPSIGPVAPPPPNIVIPPPAPEPPAPQTGFLRLEVEPRHLVQVFVDGAYLGTPADLGDVIELRLGMRRIELRAPGYRTLTLETEITGDRTIVYRGALELGPSTAPKSPDAGAGTSVPGAPAPGTPAPGTPAPRTPAPGTLAPRTLAPTRIFVIPGCYMGNVRPDPAGLRAGCDISRLAIVTP